MVKELTLESTYVPEWHLKEGVREFISNGLDAQTELGAQLTVQYYPNQNMLSVKTDGAVLSREVLLFGHSSKMQRSDTIGHFGEGLKLGSLACVRDGHDVTIRTGSETWKPMIVHSTTYKASVLAVEIAKGKKYMQRVAVEIQNIDQETWDDLRKMFLMLAPPAAMQSVSVAGYGSVILDPDFKGRVFVKGVQVMFDEKLRYGYDLLDVTTDRDRKMVQRWDMDWRVRYMWMQALNQRPDLVPGFQEMLMEEAQDVRISDSSDVYYMDSTVAQALADNFFQQFGDKAFPCGTTAEARDLEFVGKRGVVVPKAYQAVLARTIGTVSELQEGLKTATLKVFSWMELDPMEKALLTEAIDDVHQVVPGLTLAMVDVVEFRDPVFCGLFKEGRLQLARSILKDIEQTLITLVHEAGHFAGADGTRDHVEAQDTIWAKMYARMKAKVRVVEGN